MGTPRRPGAKSAFDVARFVRLFPLWVVLGGVLGLLYPPSFAWFLDYGLVTPGLQVIMLGMGLTLELSDFSRVARRPGAIAWGVGLQYVVMPSVGWVCGYLFQRPTAVAVGLVLVCCCPGGTASNVIAYLAKADVALSVSMTAVSTLLAALCTPLLVEWLAGSRVEVDVLGLFWSTLEVVLLPVALGLGLLGAVASAHALGFGIGFFIAGLAHGCGATARTISIEVGMQNSGLGAVLAQAHFANPLTAVPSAISAVVHSVLGSALAAYWSRRPVPMLPRVARRETFP